VNCPPLSSVTESTPCMFNAGLLLGAHRKEDLRGAHSIKTVWPIEGRGDIPRGYLAESLTGSLPKRKERQVKAIPPDHFWQRGTSQKAPEGGESSGRQDRRTGGASIYRPSSRAILGGKSLWSVRGRRIHRVAENPLLKKWHLEGKPRLSESATGKLLLIRPQRGRYACRHQKTGAIENEGSCPQEWTQSRLPKRFEERGCQGDPLDHT